ncbi:aldehyde dehydrogenase family protein [Lunatimonas salinarum]|uniref:aldehyde dehydrogenase family protein n=1 Tax=Lunatimonas salinarum TaxID=1774590 RepID=UPI001ADF909A|nr:aldehyde dehydrogenase family protein [Lunatimonas salinarum]
MQVINPANGAVITEIPADTREQVQSKIEKLRKGQGLWADVPVEERLAAILRFGELVSDEIDNLAVILTQETGKPLQQSINEIKGANNRLVHLKANAKKWLVEEVMVDEGATKEHIAYEPLGVVANISAWNFPYNVGYNVFLYALVAGNAVIYKPSEFASLTGLKFRELLWKAGIPANAFECVIGTGEVGQMLLDADLDGYFFTGSYATGRYIATQVAPKLVPMQLELGGKDPLYVMDDVADIKQAAINAAEGAFYNNGQSCCAVERIYVQAGIYDQFVEYFVEEVKAYKIGDPMDKTTFIGPLTRKPQQQVLLDQVQDALLKGAELKHGGFSPEGPGYYFTPTVLTSVTHDMDVMKEESFGPIIGIQKVGNDDEALNLMMDTPYGLTAAVFGTDKDRALALLKQLPVGTAYWNCCDRVSPNVPWSGRKNSGLGSTLSYQGIRAFVQPKAYHLRD